MKKRILALILTLAAACAALTGCVKVVPLTSGTANSTAEGEQSAQSYIEGMFQKEAVPALKKKAIDFTKLMTEANGDLKTVGEKYGRRADASSPYNFTVKGTATVKEVKTDLRAGYIVLKVNGYTGNAVVKMAVGPVFKGTSTRDSIDAIKFDDYENQVAFAELSTAIHKKITQTVFSKIKAADLMGKTIDFYGTFADEKTDEILITPFEITVK